MTKNPCRTCKFGIYTNSIHRRTRSWREVCMKCEKYDAHQKYLQSKRKFRQGDQITSLEELVKHEWFIWHGQTKHIEMFRSMSLRTVEQFINNGSIYEAIRKE